MAYLNEPSVPGVPNPPQLPQNTSGTGLPTYKDLTLAPTSSPVVPGSPEWYQSELPGIFGAPIFIGITPGPVVSGPQSEHGGGGPIHMEGASNYTNTERLYKAFLALSHANKNAYMMVQGQLYDAGMYGDSPRTSVHWGLLDDASRDAFKKALGNYVAASTGAGVPLTWDEFMVEQAKQGRINQSQGGVGGGVGGAPATPVVQLQDPASLRQAAEQAAQASLGHGLSEDELSQFVSEFQTRQTNAQMAAQTATGTSPVSVTQPDMIAEANAFGQQENPQGYANHQAQAYTNAFLNIFLSPGSQRGNIQPVPRA